jgi:phospholipase C
MRKKLTARQRRKAGYGLLAASVLGGSLAAYAATTSGSATAAITTPATATTPIQHVVVLFDENESFDHYFGTYPNAANTDGTTFTAYPGTPIPNNYISHPNLAAPVSASNPNGNPNLAAPYRLSPSQAYNSGESHNYTPEQNAMGWDGTKPLMDRFVQTTGASNTNNCSATAAAGNAQYCSVTQVMGYFDGNTVTGLWNLAQNFAMSDNSWADNFGPSTVGALNVVSGMTGGAISYATQSASDNHEKPTPATTKTGGVEGNVSAASLGTDAAGSSLANALIGSVNGDPDPAFDDCDKTNGQTAGMTGKNIGDLLNAKGVSWGYFAGGITPSTPSTWDATGVSDGDQAKFVSSAACGTKAADRSQVPGVQAGEDAPFYAGAGNNYNAHHNPFAYYKSTSNPHHFLPTAGVPFGTDDPSTDPTVSGGAVATSDVVEADGSTGHAEGHGANHQYDLAYFYQALKGDNAVDQLPAVSYVKADYAEDAHPGNSDPLDEQHFIARTVDAIENSPFWSSTAIVIAYDDSDGWYDHQPPTVLSGSSDITGTASTGTNGTTDAANGICTAAYAKGVMPAGGWEDRCGPSQRLPFLVISPYAKQNYIDHTQTSQASIVKFIEDNWNLGRIDDAGTTVPTFSYPDPSDGTKTVSTTAGTVGKGSFDAIAGSITGMFDFSAPKPGKVILDPNTGAVTSDTMPRPTTGNNGNGNGGGGTALPPTASPVAQAKAHLKADKAKLKKVKKKAKKAHGAKKVKLEKKIKKLKKQIKKDHKAVKAAS